MIAPDTDVEMLADVICEHFSRRWGQDAPVSREEALLVAAAFETRREHSLGGASEMTESMLAAGERMLAEEIGICGADVARDIAETVFTAMWAARTHRTTR